MKIMKSHGKELIEKATQEKIEVMKAFIEGKTIQCTRVDYNDGWYDCNPCWDWKNFEYRVKPEAPEKSFTLFSYGFITQYLNVH